MNGKRSVLLTYGAVGLMALSFFAVIGFGAWAAVDARNRADTNRMLIARLAVEEARVRELTRSTHDALCSFKLDLRQRADNTASFIAEIEEGTRPPIAGISIADLKRSLEIQLSTLASLSDLNC